MTGPATLLFWATAALAGLAVALLLVRPMLRRDTDAPAPPDADTQVYRDQLAEVARDIARGTLDAAEGEALRTEISRRLLAAVDRADAATATPPGGDRRVPVVTAILVLLGGLALYGLVGSPGTPDQPRAARIAANRAAYDARPTQAEMEARMGVTADPAAALPAEQRVLLDRLRQVLETRPDDLKGHELLEGFLADLQDWSGAARAQARIIAIKGAAATAQDHLTLAEHLIFAVNGYVSPEAEAALHAVLTRDPENGAARYFSGLAALQAGRPDIAYDLWTRLLSEGPDDAAWIAPIRSQIRDVALAANRAVPELRGPAPDDLAAARDMTEADRARMIRGMVDGLSDRLATQGGPAEDWAQLIRSLGVLGERGRANDVLHEALDVFAESPADLAIIRAAGREAEILQ